MLVSFKLTRSVSYILYILSTQNIINIANNNSYRIKYVL